MIVNYIDVEAWNAARWGATAFLYRPDLSAVPSMALVYRDEPAARRIFQAWKDNIGPRDRFEEIRVSIIEGDIPRKKPGYTVLIVANPEGVAERIRTTGAEPDMSEWSTISRHHRMNPAPGSLHLNYFKRSFQRHGRFFLMPAVTSDDSFTQIRPLEDLALEKRSVHFRHVNEISDTEMDAIPIRLARQGDDND